MTTELGHRAVVGDARPFVEELRRLGRRERLDEILHLAADAEAFPRRDENVEVRTALDERCERRRGVDDLLEVVEHQEHLPIPNLSRELASYAQRPGDRLDDEIRIA